MAVKKGEVQEGIAKAAGKPVAKTPAKKPVVKKTAAKAAAGEAKPKRMIPARKGATPKPGPKLAPVDEPLYKKCGITLQAALFCDHYLTHYNATQALWDAGYKAANRNVAAVDAHKLMQKPGVRQYIAEKMKGTFDRLEQEQDKLIQTLTYVAYANPNELSENRIDCCRFCYGTNHGYQFTPQEFERHREQHAIDVAEARSTGTDGPDFDPKGGIGFNPNNVPHEDCPECFGRGIESVVFKDTRYLSPAALALYASTKTTKDGKEVKTNDQAKARETLAKIHKLYDDKTEVNIVTMDTETLEEKFASKMRTAHERQAKVLEERAALKDD